MYKVAVSGINAIDNPGPGLGVIKGIREENLDTMIVGLAYDAMEPGVYMDWIIDKVYLMPYPSEGERVYLNRLLYIKENFGLDVIIPTLDTELPLLIDLSDQLKSYGISSFLPTKEQFKLRSKEKLPALSKEAHIKTPKTVTVTSLEDLSRAIQDFTFPVMIKGLFYKAYKAYNLQEANHYFCSIANEWGLPILLQEVISGEEINVVGVGDGEGGHFGLLAIKKLWITSLGKIWTGVTIHNDNLIKTTERFLQITKWRGAFEFECIIKNEEIFLIEINPRFPAWIYFSVGVGINLPGRLLKAALNLDPYGDSFYEAGKLYIRYTEDFVTDIDNFQKLIIRGER